MGGKVGMALMGACWVKPNLAGASRSEAGTNQPMLALQAPRGLLCPTFLPHLHLHLHHGTQRPPALVDILRGRSSCLSYV